MTKPQHAPITEPRLKAFELANVKLTEPTEDGTLGTFTGIASAVGVVDRHNEVIEKGAFDACLKEKGADYPLLWQHRSDQPIGIITLSTDPAGNLVGEGKINLETQLGREAYALLKQGAIGAMSIGFNIPAGGAAWDEKESRLRILLVEVWETSLVTFPANPGALVDAVKAMHGDLEHLKAGRVLSGANRSKLEAARDALQAVLDADMPGEEEKSDDAIGTALDPVELAGVKSLIAEMRGATFSEGDSPA